MNNLEDLAAAARAARKPSPPPRARSTQPAGRWPFDIKVAAQLSFVLLVVWMLGFSVYKAVEQRSEQRLRDLRHLEELNQSEHDLAMAYGGSLPWHERDRFERERREIEKKLGMR